VTIPCLGGPAQGWKGCQGSVAQSIFTFCVTLPGISGMQK